MRLLSLVSLGAIAAGRVLGQSEFEPADFNATEALLANGVDPSILLSLENTLEGSVLARTTPCAIACATLQKVFGVTKLFTTDVLSYWSAQQDAVTPVCTFKPTTALEVSTLVLLSRVAQCPFAVKGGGHAAFKGASNIDGGVTISLEKFNKIQALPSGVASIGAGSRWYDVYTTLQRSNLAVVGGRASSVGVSGLTLGGGISHHTNLRGFACDNVAEYEVVTASGLILYATPKQYPDLYWALRGGGPNFGIVTNFKLETFSQGPMWGGSRDHTPDAIPAARKAFVNMINNAAQDPNAAHWMIHAAAQQAPGVKIVSSELEYPKQFSPSSPPAILKEYLAIPAYEDNTGNRTLAEITVLLNDSMPAGNRQSFWSAAFKNDLGMVDFIGDYFFSTVAEKFPVASIAYQSISKPALTAMARNGGNALGLKAADGPFFHILLAVTWQDASQDTAVYKGAKAFIDAITAEAKKRNLASSYIYMNYASPYQKVIDGYGSANVAKLKSIAEKYDPAQIFQKLQPGGFKLNGAPFGTNP
ncbi:hypothetical protein N0V90_004832 [Kalmusia sp. IMI 367209]|nr:hypothetical protein N0V90_004832 [Kalmusia sp. IMI 367209]